MIQQTVPICLCALLLIGCATAPETVSDNAFKTVSEDKTASPNDGRVYASENGAVQLSENVQITPEQIAKAFSNVRPDGCTGQNDLNARAAEGARRRVVAALPRNSKKSGHCKIRLDVDPQGDPMNVQVVSCSDEFFRTASRWAVAKWSYDPLIEDGNMKPRCSLETKMSFRMMDRKGRLIPE